MADEGLFEDTIVWDGEALKIGEETDAILARMYPELDRFWEYREADRWLVTHSRRFRNVRNWLINVWFARSLESTRLPYCISDSVKCHLTPYAVLSGRFTMDDLIRWAQCEAERAKHWKRSPQ